MAKRFLNGIWTNDITIVNAPVNLIDGVNKEYADLAIKNVIEDTTPQLGGDLDVNGFSIINLPIAKRYAFLIG